MDHQWIFPCIKDRAYDGDTIYLELDIGFALKHFVYAGSKASIPRSFGAVLT